MEEGLASAPDDTHEGSDASTHRHNAVVLVRVPRGVHTQVLDHLGASMPDVSIVPAVRASARRSFLARVAGVLAAIPLVDRRMRGASRRATATEPQPNAMPLSALAAAVLPAELGSAGTARAVANFQRWMDGYRPGAEVNHGYGTGRIERLEADPRPQWRSQLAALDADARRAGGRSFGALTIEQRQAIVRAALAGERGETLPAPLAARHVAVALLAHFYESPEANDLCYEAQIGRQQCRPLAAQGQRPVPLSRRGR